MRTLYLLFIALVISVSGFSQARMIFNGTIGLKFSGGDVSTPIYVVVDNSNENAITVPPAGGAGILSENEGHIVKWNIDESDGTYIVPFIDLVPSPRSVAAIVQVGAVNSGTNNGSKGAIEFATFPHDNTLGGAASEVTHFNLHPSGAPGGETTTFDRFWIMAPVDYSVNPTARVGFIYDDTETDGANMAAGLRIQRFNPSGGLWFDYNAGLATTYMGITNSVFTVNPIPGNEFFRSWVITGGDTPLPIELLSFDSECKGSEGVTLEWSTATEINNSHFTIERSEDGIVWEVIADDIRGAGNSSSTRDYTYLDNNPFRGLTYYQLTQTDYDGTSETFQPIVNDCDGVGFEIISAFDHEASNSIQLVVSAARDEAFGIELYDMGGKLSGAQQGVMMQEGLNYLSIDKNNISAGVYIVKLQSERELMTRRLAINR